MFSPLQKSGDAESGVIHGLTIVVNYGLKLSDKRLSFPDLTIW
ncbi:MAG: hypothetical protein ACKO85_06255 [Isosphaeraceae bacterium]